MNQTDILMIGAGRMAEAILSGLASKESKMIGKVTVANQSDQERLSLLTERYSLHTSKNWQNDVALHQVIILATPPSTHDEILRLLGNLVDGQLIITVAAGIDPVYMERRLPEGTPVCWIMPNIAAQIGKSMSTYVYGKYVNESHQETISVILNAIGEAEELSQKQVHDLTAITGSAPAFVYSFVEGLETAAIENGVSPQQARKLVVNMLSGSVAMLEEGYEPENLIQQVASPGGSTAEGLKILEKAQFKEIVQEAIRATNAHAKSNTTS